MARLGEDVEAVFRAQKPLGLVDSIYSGNPPDYYPGRELRFIRNPRLDA